MFEHSQSFICALLTLMVLCLFNQHKEQEDDEVNSEESNFVRRLLFCFNKEIKSDINEKRTTFNSRLSSTLAYNTLSFNKYKSILRVLQQSDSKFAEISAQLLTLYEKMVAKQADLYNISFKYVPKIDNCIKKIHESKDIELIFYFTFLYTLLVLSFDAFIGEYNQTLIRVIYLITIASFAFSFLLWYHFWLRTSCKFDKHRYVCDIQNKGEETLLTTFLHLISTIVKIVFRLVVLVLLPVLSAYIFERFESSWFVLVNILLVTVLFYLGSIKLRNKLISTEHYNRSFILIHFFYIVIAFFVFLKALSYIPSLESLIISYLDRFLIVTDSLTIKRVGNISFILILINTIIFPLCIPYFRVAYYKKGLDINLKIKYLTSLFQIYKIKYCDFRKISKRIDKEYALASYNIAEKRGQRSEQIRIAKLMKSMNYSQETIISLTGISEEDYLSL